MEKHGQKAFFDLQEDIKTLSQNIDSLYKEKPIESFTLLLKEKISNDYHQVENGNLLNYALKFLDFQHFYIAFKELEMNYSSFNLEKSLNELRHNLDNYCEKMAYILRDFTINDIENFSNNTSGKINISPANPDHIFPDLVETFSEDLKIFRDNFLKHDPNKYKKGLEYAYPMIYYGLMMCIEYQKKGTGDIPQNIVDEIWHQVEQGGIKGLDVVNKTKNQYLSKIRNAFYVKIKEPGIVSETEKFWNAFSQ